MNTELATNGPSRLAADPGHRGYSLADVDMMAKHAADSGLFGMSRPQAFTLMLIAWSEGLDPIQALKRYHVIDNRPAMRADAMQAEYQRRGGRLHWIKTTAEECQAEAWHPTLHPDHMIFTLTLKELAESKVAMAWDRDKKEFKLKSNYARHPRQMLRARIISEIVRAIDPGVVVGIYTPEELVDVSEAERAAEPHAVVIERPSGPTLIHEPTHEPRSAEISEPRAWLRRTLQTADDAVRNHFVIENKVDLFKPLANEYQLIQGLISNWVEAGSVDERTILKSNGKRDPAKVGATFQVAWYEDADRVKADARAYLVDKAVKLFRASGLDMPEEMDLMSGDSDESLATADED